MRNWEKMEQNKVGKENKEKRDILAHRIRCTVDR